MNRRQTEAELYQEWKPVIESIARRHWLSSWAMPFDDYRQAAALGWLEALRNHDDTRSALGTWLRNGMDHKIVDTVRAATIRPYWYERGVRLAVHDVHEMIDESHSSVEDQALASCVLDRVLQRLTPRQQDILIADCAEDPGIKQSVAKAYGITPGRVSQITKQVRKKLDD